MAAERIDNIPCNLDCDHCPFQHHGTCPNKTSGKHKNQAEPSIGNPELDKPRLPSVPQALLRLLNAHDRLANIKIIRQTLETLFPNLKGMIDRETVRQARMDRFITYLIKHAAFLSPEQLAPLLTHLLTSIAEEENMMSSQLIYQLDLEDVAEDNNLTTKTASMLRAAAQNLSLDNCILEQLSSVKIRDIKNSHFVLQKICVDSVRHAAIEAEKDRYLVELGQWLALKAELVKLIPQQTHAWFNNFNKELRQQETKLLTQAGFSLAKSEDRIALNYKLNTEHNNRLWLGPPLTYFMSKAPTIHQESLAVLVVGRLVYDQAQHQFYLQQTQRLVNLNNQQLYAIGRDIGLPKIEKLSSKQLSNLGIPEQQIIQIRQDRIGFQDLSPEIKEKILMRSILTVPQKLQTQDPKQIIRNLVHIADPNFNPKQESVDSTVVGQYSKLLLHALQTELQELGLDISHKQLVEPEQISALAHNHIRNMLEMVVVKGLHKLDHKIEKEQVSTLEQVYNQFRDESPTVFARAVASMANFTPALERISSISMCVGLSPASFMNKMAKLNSQPQLIAKMHAGTLNQTDLIHLVGKKRAEKFHLGVCKKCGRKTMVGECDYCFQCELEDGLGRNFNKLNELGKGVNQNKQPQHSYTTYWWNWLLMKQFYNHNQVGLSGFVSGNDKRIVGEAPERLSQKQPNQYPPTATYPQPLTLAP